MKNLLFATALAIGATGCLEVAPRGKSNASEVTQGETIAEIAEKMSAGCTASDVSFVICDLKLDGEFYGTLIRNCPASGRQYMFDIANMPEDAQWETRVDPVGEGDGVIWRNNPDCYAEGSY